MSLRALTLWVVLALTLLALPAWSQEARRAGTIRLETATGDRGPIVLEASADGYTGEIVLANEGKEPLVVSRLSVRGDAADPRVPGRVTVTSVDGPLPLTIPPAGSRRATVAWLPGRDMRMRQLFGHVVVTSSDEQTGEAAIGVRAHLSGLLGFLEDQWIALLLGCPLFGALLALMFRTRGWHEATIERRIACFSLALQTLVALTMAVFFSTEVSRLDGNDGLQFVVHGVWVRSMAAEMFLGVDGLSMVPLLVVSMTAFLAVVSERSRSEGAWGYYVAYLLVDATLLGSMCAMDAVLFLLLVSLAMVTASVLLGGWGSHPERALHFALVGCMALALLGLFVVGACSNADPTFLVDGSRTDASLSFPEWSRVAFVAKDAHFLGVGFSKIGFALVLAASILLLGAFPFHGWLLDVLVSAPTSAAVLVAAGFPFLGACTLVRLGAAIVPDGMRWGAGLVVALGAVTAAYGGLRALGETRLRHLLACSTTSSLGIALMGFGSLTPQGLTGGLAVCATRALGGALLLLLAEAMVERFHTDDVTRWGGVARTMPLWALGVAASAVSQSGVFGGACGWGTLLAFFGALPHYAPLVVIASFGVFMQTIAYVLVLSRIVFRPLSRALRDTQGLRGTLPDLTPRERLGVIPLVTVLAVLGLWPTYLLASMSGTVRDVTNAVNPPGPDQIALR